MNLTSSRFEVFNSSAPTYAAEAADAESADLAVALAQAKTAPEEADRIRAAHAAAREALRCYFIEIEEWNDDHTLFWDDKGKHSNGSETPPPKYPKIEFPSGLPPEFSDYLEGAAIWRNAAVKDKSGARQAWERLLARPPAERHFKSTWAAFMLGKSLEQEDPGRAVRYFEQVRELAGHGFADSAGLASASLGLEARVDLHQQKFEWAIDLYLQQWATGDEGAARSLEITARNALHGSDKVLQSLARNPVTEHILTAWLLANPPSEPNDPNSATPAQVASDQAATNDAPQAQTPGDARRWLNAAEAAGITNVEASEKLALVAYQNGEMDEATRWISRSSGSFVTRWLQAKLILRSGKLADACSILEGIAPAFPIEPHGTNEVAPTTFRDALYFRGDYRSAAGMHLLGEVGVIRLSLGQYTQALDAFLRGGYWMDAAYVAERVLTTDELKAYVDTYWPTASAEQTAGENEGFVYQPDANPASIREKIRYLLARRLTRVIRGNESRPYYPEERVPLFDELAQALITGWDESLPASERAQALFRAAQITRTNGLELIGTEVEPDWHLHDGEVQYGVTVQGRATNPCARLFAAGKDELDRAAQNKADPEVRFHYRYQAAFLAWEAARLMPNNSDETAMVLWTAGCWLKNRDPITADLFYKALVRRNRGTALGQEADHRRWFPNLYDTDNLLPASEPMSPDQPAGEQKPADPANQDGQGAGDGTAEQGADQPYLVPQNEGGYAYMVRMGDSLAGIVRLLNKLGVAVTMRNLLDANPGLEPGRLLVGQRLMIVQPGQSP